MSRMKNLDTRLGGLEGWHVAHAEAMKSIACQLDQMLHLMKDMVLLEGKIETMEAEIVGRLNKMEASQVDSGKLVDRLIEMSMTQGGHAAEAVTHRAQSRLENDFSSKQSWVEEEEDDVWPPKNSDVMDSKG